MASNVFSPLADLFNSNPHKIWIKCDREEFSGEKLNTRIADAQSRLECAGVVPHDTVLIFSGRSASFWIDVLAVWGLGCVAVPVDVNVNDQDLSYIIKKSEPGYVLGSFDRKIESLIKVADFKDLELSRGDVKCVQVSSSSTASILFTSGSTGEPKGVMLSHAAVAGNAFATLSSFEMNNVSELFAPIPFRFVSSLSHFLATLYNKVTYSGTERKFLKTDLLEELQASQADAFGGSPLQLRWIAELATEYDLNLTWLMASGDNLPVQTIEALRQTMPGIRIVTAYGLTEVAGRFCVLPPSATERKAGSVGKPIPGLTYKVLDEEMKEVAAGESGQVFIDGSYVFSGYINDLEKTRDVLFPEGFASGDMGYVDSEGFLYLEGRSDDVFKSGGLKVSTLPIAAQLMSSGMFEDVAVFPQKDEILGNVPVVYYVPKQGEEFKKGPLMRLLRSKLPPGHLPREFTVLSNIPRTGSGKVQRGVLRQIISNLNV